MIDWRYAMRAGIEAMEKAMADDITVKLYEWYSYLPTDDKNRPLVGEAMDEINRLRSTIEQLRLVAGPASIDAVKFADIKKFAKNPVLGEFNDGK